MPKQTSAHLKYFAEYGVRGSFAPIGSAYDSKRPEASSDCVDRIKKDGVVTAAPTARTHKTDTPSSSPSVLVITEIENVSKKPRNAESTGKNIIPKTEKPKRNAIKGNFISEISIVIYPGRSVLPKNCIESSPEIYDTAGSSAAIPSEKNTPAMHPPRKNAAHIINGIIFLCEYVKIPLKSLLFISVTHTRICTGGQDIPHKKLNND